MKFYIHVSLFFISIILLHHFPLAAQEVSLDAISSEAFDRPLGLEYSHDGDHFIYIVNRRGAIRRVDKNDFSASSESWFTMPNDVSLGAEGGLLGLAFHPDFPGNDSFFINYTYEDGDQIKTRISRFSAPDGEPDLSSEEIILEFDQPASNHNGGALKFGPDGYLYISSGDGGGSGSRDNSQDTSNLLGTILRIDIDAGNGYVIPDDNPFIDDSDILDEIYAYGLRNPWRMSFDRETGHLWVADVGPSSWEVIHVVEKGKNYGYPIIVGSHCRIQNCDASGLEMPVFEYAWGEDDTGQSITGGYVYRGNRNPSLYGKYIYGDYISGRIWALEVDHETLEVISNTELLHTDYSIASFGQDSSGELYVLDFDSNGQIYSIITDDDDWADNEDDRADDDDRTDDETSDETERQDPVVSNLDVSVDDASVHLSWDLNENTQLQEFRIYRGENLDEMNMIATVDGTVFEYTDSELRDGTSFYVVTAVGENGRESEFSNIVSSHQSILSISEEWTIVSIPVESEGLRFQNTIVYGFDGVYNTEEELVSGRGYLVRSSTGETLSVKGKGVTEKTIALRPGWNLIGSLIGQVTVDQIEDPDDILADARIYSFVNRAYQEVTTLQPSQGYWIYSSESGSINYRIRDDISISESLDTSASQDAGSGQDFKRIRFSYQGSEFSFWVADESVSHQEQFKYLLPPRMPGNSLDIRTEDGFNLSDAIETSIELTTPGYPVGVILSGDEDSDYVYRINAENNNGDQSLIYLLPGERAVIDREYDHLSLEKVNRNEAILSTSIDPGFPNPFNPTTNIRYRLAQPSDVTVDVFDVAGRRVRTLVNEMQQTGVYTIQFDGSDLSSGVYFLRMQAGDFVDIQKLTLIK